MCYPTGEGESRSKDAESLALRSLGQIVVEGDKFQTRGILLGCHKRSPDLQRVCCPQRMRLDHPLRIPANHLYRRHLRPSFPSAEQIPPGNAELRG